MAAADEAELVHMVATAAAIDDRPSALRYPRGDGVGVEMPEVGVPLEIGKGRILREGNTVALLSYGTRLAECMKAAEALAAHGLTTTVADARFAKPLDIDLVLRLAQESRGADDDRGRLDRRVRFARAADSRGARRARPRPEGPHRWFCRICSSITIRRRRCMRRRDWMRTEFLPRRSRPSART